uniref:Uncharacterized protein n=1 Tax=Sphaerodactylus townsendi TaxID=933632 RepID=A0ACB8ENL8_9SAUR
MLSATEERVSQTTWHHGRRRPSMLSSGWTCGVCDHAVRESGRYKISAGMPRSQPPAVGASKDRATEFTAANALLLEDAVVASLETHVLVKRVQHHLGLPLTLLKSLRSFMLPSPDLTLQRSRREVSVLTRPQALSFVGSGTRKNLESHLEKMVHLKRWQLPQKIQEALGQMKPPFQSIEKTPPSPARKQGPGVTSQVKYAGKMQRTSAMLPTREGVLDSKTTLASQAELPSHLVKKSLEIRLQTFPTLVGHSQKLSSRSRALHLPKLIPLGRSCPQWRNRLSLLLRGKADIVEMNIKCKYIHFLWGLPTLYMQSLGKMAPGPLALPTAPAWAHATMEFVSVEPPFVKTSVLENHVLRKRLQHQWGLPGLALQSLKQFLVLVPPSPIHGASVVRSHLEVKILTGAHPFLSTRLEMEKLEAHMKTKIIERRWGLPRRALDSLRVFIPVAPPLSDRPKANKETFALPQGEKSMRRKPPSRPSRTSENLMISSAKAVQGPLAKKALEVRLGTINPMAQRSQDAARRVGKMHPLPKVIFPGLRPLVTRSPELLFMGQAVLGHLQLNVIHKTLMYRWRLPTTYNKSLAQMFQGAGAAHFARSPSKSTESNFTSVQTPFISREDREVLEWHVRGKRLQHTWGLPGLVQRSLRHLLPTTLPLRPQRGRPTEVVVSLTEPAFLDNSTRRELERNVQKRIIHQQWRLPRRVLQSLRRLQPTWNADTLSLNPPLFPFAGRRESFSRKAGRLSLSASPITEALCTECYVKNMGAAAPKRSQRFPRLGSQNLKKIELHSTKKCLEVQLEACPAIVKHSRKLTPSVCGRTLPKLLPPGRKALQPRKSSLPLVSQEDMGRIEVAVRVCHLMSLWGLGTRYMEGLHAMIPRTPAHSLGRGRRTGLEFSEGKVPFLDSGTREALESHVRKKRLQHEWGLPVLVRSSVQAFAKGFPLAPVFLRTKTDVQTLPQDSAFLPQETCTHLEHHLQRRKLQQQWGVPLRVLKSLHMLMPETGTRPVDRTLLTMTITFSAEFSSRLCKGFPMEGATDRAQDTEEAPEMVGRAPCRACQGSTLKGAALEKMQRHLAKRSVEIHLEAFPAVPRRSWWLASLSVKPPLPKLIPPGHRDLEPRRSSFPFLKSKEMGRVELALRCSWLASLWGLGTRYVEILTVMAPRPPFHPVKRQRAAFGLPEGQPPCFTGLDPETLEMHVKKKRMQHEWGLPSLALRSLGGFMQGTPTLPPLPKTAIHVNAKLQEPSFLPGFSCRLLEFHVQRMKLQRMWGLPGRILASSKALMAPPLAGRERKKKGAGDRGRPDTKRARRIGRPSQATSVGLW